MILVAKVRVVVSAVDIVSRLNRQSEWKRRMIARNGAYSAPAMREVVHSELECCAGCERLRVNIGSSKERRERRELDG